MFLYPPICDLASVILKEKGWYEQFENGEKTIEVQFCEGNRAIMRYTHMVLHPGRLLRGLGIRKNLIGKKKRVLGPFSTPEAAFEAVGGCGLGMDMEGLRKFMTKLRMDPDRVKRPRVIPVVLHCLKYVRATNSIKWIENTGGNQAGLRRHEFHSKHDDDGVMTSLFRYRRCKLARIGEVSIAVTDVKTTKTLAPSSDHAVAVQGLVAAVGVARPMPHLEGGVAYSSGCAGLRRLGVRLQ
jgi:hypothetical protein